VEEQFLTTLASIAKMSAEFFWAETRKLTFGQRKGHLGMRIRGASAAEAWPRPTGFENQMFDRDHVRGLAQRFSERIHSPALFNEKSSFSRTDQVFFFNIYDGFDLETSQLAYSE